MPKPKRPQIGAIVHFYELEDGTPEAVGPLPAIVTGTEEAWAHNSRGEVHLAVFEQMALRFIPLVPYADGGKEAGQWWTWPVV